MYLKSCHNKYMSAQPNGKLEWNRDRKGPWENFRVLNVENGKIALQSVHGKYVSAQPDGSIEVNRDNVAGWETFIVISCGASEGNEISEVISNQG